MVPETTKRVHHQVRTKDAVNSGSANAFAKFSTQITREDSDIVGLPVICSRLFRFSAFYVNKKSGIKTVQDLKGKRVGSPEWAHSAAVYMRGWMHNDMGVKLTDDQAAQISISLKVANPAAVKQLIADQQDPHSPSYHAWLTPEEYGQQFGQRDVFLIAKAHYPRPNVPPQRAWRA